MLFAVMFVAEGLQSLLYLCRKVTKFFSFVLLDFNRLIAPIEI